MDTITWITAQTYRGTDSIVAEASSNRTLERFLARAERVGALVSNITRSVGYHWDGGKLSRDEAARIRRGIARNAA